MRDESNFWIRDPPQSLRFRVLLQTFQLRGTRYLYTLNGHNPKSLQWLDTRL